MTEQIIEMAKRNSQRLQELNGRLEKLDDRMERMAEGGVSYE